MVILVTLLQVAIIICLGYFLADNNSDKKPTEQCNISNKIPPLFLRPDFINLRYWNNANNNAHKCVKKPTVGQ